jgi:threonylcarbamoyladenosine tRNA methylthiotransferase MtaB
VLACEHAEIVLTGVHIGSYGRDLDESHSLSDLVERLVAQIPTVRFRLSSVEATQLDDPLLDLMAGASDRLAPHVHAPLQSGSDRILKRMGRRWYTAEQYRVRLERLADRVARLGLGADLIVGFPGETEEDFSATQSLIEALPFTYLHVFPYSRRPIAPSARLGPDVGPETKRHRAQTLRALVEAKRTAYKASRQGELGDVVRLRRVGGSYEGLTEDYLPVSVATDPVPPKRFKGVLRMRGAALWAEITGS